MRFLFTTALSIAVALSACSTPRNTSDVAIPLVPKQETAMKIIATDFVNALRQLPSVQPASTTVDLQYSQQDDGFTEEMRRAFEQAGYGLRWVEDEGSATFFQYRAAAEPAAASAQQKTFELAVGPVEMRRSYTIDKSHRVRPVTPLYVRGVDASGIVLDDAIFISSTTASKYESASTAASKDKSESTLLSKDQSLSTTTTASTNERSRPYTENRELRAVPPVSTIPTKPLMPVAPSKPTSSLSAQNHRLQVHDDANPLSPLVRNSTAVNPLSLPLLDSSQRENVFAIGGSNFDAILSGHRVLQEQVLTFANDSMRLGVRNKVLVEQMVQRFDPNTDIFSVIGCSLGPTQVRGGNAALALGRAGRVVEALRFAGVTDRHILDEGCWAGDGTFDSLPHRGVVISLNRRV